MNSNEVMLTVKMLAYNHERYIAQAIESILAQKTEYKYEILIGEDCSTDGTREIVRKYASEYPDIVRPILHKKNMGCTKNSYSLDIHARGKYVAGCEGDDYWCDETRIQRDVDFLESHPEYVGICHKCKIVDEIGNEIGENEIAERAAFWKFSKEIFTLKDFEEWKIPGHGSAQTRRNMFKNSNQDYSIVYKASKRVGDRTHLLIHVVEGDIYCMNDVVSCYRYRTSGNQNNFMEIQKRNNLKAEEYLMMCRLENWAKKSKGKKLDLSRIKKDRFAGSIVIFMKNPSKENWKVVCDIIKYSRQPIKYMFYALKIFILKTYYWKVLKTDKLISL